MLLVGVQASMFEYVDLCSFMDVVQVQRSHLFPKLLSSAVPDFAYLRHDEWHLIGWCCCFIVINLAFFYLATWISFAFNRISEDRVKVPPTLPYVVTYLGHALSLLIEPARTIIGVR